MPRPLNEQTIVMTGASSGFGREASVLFGGRGANVVLAARDEEALREVAAEVEQAGGRALAVPTDVADWPAVGRLAAAAVERFGRIDTWVNNAGIGLGGRIEDVSVEEIARVVQVNLMGLIHGVKAALPALKRQGEGAFINIGSVAGIRTFPLQTTYCATKHAVKGFTEGLRLELEREGPDYHVTYIAPTAINTPFFQDARARLDGKQIEPPPPVYDPRIVAESIVFAAENPRRDIFIGGGRLFDLMQRLSPALVDRISMLGDNVFKQQVSDRPVDHADNLFHPPDAPRAVRGQHPEKAGATSLYTKAFEWHPFLKPAAVGAVALGALALLRRSSRPRGPVDRLRDAAEQFRG